MYVCVSHTQTISPTKNADAFITALLLAAKQQEQEQEEQQMNDGREGGRSPPTPQLQPQSQQQIVTANKSNNHNVASQWLFLYQHTAQRRGRGTLNSRRRALGVIDFRL